MPSKKPDNYSGSPTSSPDIHPGNGQPRNRETDGALFRSLFASDDIGMTLLDERGIIVDVNHSFETLFHCERQEILGRLLDEVVCKPMRSEHKESDRPDTNPENAFQEAVRSRQDGSIVHVSILTVPTGPRDKPTGTCISYRDITEQHVIRERIHESEERLRMVISNLPVILYALDTDGVFTLSEGKALRALGLTPGRGVGQSIYDIYPDMPDFHARFQAALQGDTPVTTYEAAGRVFETQYAPLRDGDQHITGVIAMAHDVTANREMKRRLEHMAHHDTLTGLPNRVLFADRVAEAIRRARRSGKAFALLFVDLDGFKLINDSLGHATGDQILQTVGLRFRGIMRECDTVARIGGDEFAVLVEELADRQDAAKAALKLLGTLSEPLAKSNIPISSSASIGISVYPDNGDQLECLLANADRAMYEAKSSRSSYRFYSSALLSHSAGKKKALNSLG